MILRWLNKLSGAVVGAILYPIKSLIVNFLVACLTIFGVFLAVVGLPILFSVGVYAIFNRLVPAILIGLVVGLIALIVAPAAVFISLFMLAFSTLRDLGRTFILGISDGFDKGLFFHVLRRSLFDFLIFSSTLQDRLFRVRIAFVPASNSPMSEEGLAALNAEGDDVDYTSLMDVERSSQQFDMTELEETSKVNRKFSPLTRDEIQLAQGIPSIQDALLRYNSLYERLDKLDQAMAARKEKGERNANEPLENIEDEVVSRMDITEPELLVKKFEDKHKRWKVVPACTHITDKANIERWLGNENNTHPLNNDKISAPSPYGNFTTTRYRKISYTGMSCCQELREAANTIRQGIAQNNPKNLPSPSQIITGVEGYIGSTFFGQPRTTNATPVSTSPTLQNDEDRESEVTLT